MAEAHVALGRLVEGRRLLIGVNVALLNRPGSPVFHRPRMAIPLFGGFALVVAASVVGGPILGGLVLAASIAAWVLVIGPRIRDAVHDEAIAFASASVAGFQKLWEMTAINLQRPEDGAACQAPGDWAAFVRDSAG